MTSGHKNSMTDFKREAIWRDWFCIEDVFVRWKINLRHNMYFCKTKIIVIDLQLVTISC